MIPVLAGAVKNTRNVAALINEDMLPKTCINYFQKENYAFNIDGVVKSLHIL